MSLYFWFIGFLFRLQLHSIHGGGRVIRGFCFHKIAFLISHLFLALWSGMLQSLAWRLLHLTIGAWFFIKLSCLVPILFSPSFWLLPEQGIIKTLGRAGWNKNSRISNKFENERKMEDAGCSGLTGFSLLSFQPRSGGLLAFFIGGIGCVSFYCFGIPTMFSSSVASFSLIQQLLVPFSLLHRLFRSQCLSSC